MSPEQARGEELDARTDLFSFGIVLYEMATARQAFSGASTAAIFTAILRDEPPRPSQVNPELPAELDRIITKALEKDRDLRYQHASEIRGDLKRLKRDTDSGRSAAVPAAGRNVGSGLAPALESDGGLAAGLPRHIENGGVKPPLQGASSDSQIIAGLVKRHKKAIMALMAGGIVIAAALIIPPLSHPQPWARTARRLGIYARHRQRRRPAGGHLARWQVCGLRAGNGGQAKPLAEATGHGQ